MVTPTTHFRMNKHAPVLQGIFHSCIGSHDVTIETPTNHRSSRWDIVFSSVGNHVGITRWFVISKKVSSLQITLKLHRNRDLNDCARMDILLIRLCLRPSNPNTVWKLRLSFLHVLLLFVVILVRSLTKIRQICSYGTKCVNTRKIANSPIKRYAHLHQKIKKTYFWVKRETHPKDMRTLTFAIWHT